MIEICNKESTKYKVIFISQENFREEEGYRSLGDLISYDYLKTRFIAKGKGDINLFLGTGKVKELDRIKVKEIFAKAARNMEEHNIQEFDADISIFISQFGLSIIKDIVEGLILGNYSYSVKEEMKRQRVYLQGIAEDNLQEAEKLIKESKNIVEGIIFARNAVNAPGNLLRPKDFAEKIKGLMEGTAINVEILNHDKIKELGLTALDTVGDSSSFKPYLVILSYRGEEASKESLALVGKGVTVDTGGYCLKPSSSMLGIKGDMGGGAAVAGAIYALGKNKAKTNVIGVIPICENRISSDSYLPGDVINTYSGKTVEIVNTDAEGRLILADAISYAIDKYNINKVVDIATLTGSVVNMFGFSVAGVLANNEEFFEMFKDSYELAGERYWRLPIYEEYERMLKSTIADIKNLGKAYSGTITAGLFIREFVKELPWLHLDIAGTAWVDDPIFQYQAKGATGAGVSSLYYLSIKNGEC